MSFTALSTQLMLEVTNLLRLDALHRLASDGIGHEERVCDASANVLHLVCAAPAHSQRVRAVQPARIMEASSRSRPCRCYLSGGRESRAAQSVAPEEHSRFKSRIL